MANILSPWRVQGSTGELKRLTDKGEFDEIVVGDWLHVEAMDADSVWVRLGNRVFDVFSEGGAIVVKERPEGYC